MGVVLDPAGGGLGHGVLGALQALAALALVASLGWLVWRLTRGAPPRTRSGGIEVEARLALDLRQALTIVRVEQRRFLLATSDHGTPRLIAELAACDPPSPQRSPGDAGLTTQHEAGAYDAQPSRARPPA